MNRLEEVKFDEKIALVHSDTRRDIYDPTKILDGLDNLDKLWYPHTIILIHEPLSLGNHYHNYNELFFTPTGGFLNLH